MAGGSRGLRCGGQVTEPRDPEVVLEDLRKIINYCRPLEKLVDKMTPEDLEAMEEYDLHIYRSWVGRVGIVLTNSDLDAHAIELDRIPDFTRPAT